MRVTLDVPGLGIREVVMTAGGEGAGIIAVHCGARCTALNPRLRIGSVRGLVRLLRAIEFANRRRDRA